MSSSADYAGYSALPLQGDNKDAAEPSSPLDIVRGDRKQSLRALRASGFDDEAAEKELHNIETRRQKVQSLNEESHEMEKRLEQWAAKVQMIEEKLLSVSQQKELEEEEIKSLQNPLSAKEYPGPSYLKFVEQPMFVNVSSAIIVSNLIILVLEMRHQSMAAKFWLLDQVFLAFYTTELSLKATLLHWGVLFGKIGEVWWNWLDLVIVVSGIIDQWIVPIVSAFSGGSEEGSANVGGMRFFRLLRLLRLARLLRVLKIVRILLMSDFSWTEGARFQSFIMGVILFNSILMGFEADLPHYPLWPWIEHVLLAIYSFELFVRMKRVGCQFFVNEDVVWNNMDFIIVVGGIVDQWMLPLAQIVEQEATGKAVDKIDLGEGVVLIRMARLLRILRLVRLIKNIPPLFNLIMGIVASMGGINWVILLTVVLLYAFSILSVRLLGHGHMFEVPPEVRETFPSVPESMFVLFRVMNGDASPLFPLFLALPMTKLLFAGFMIMTGWAMLGVLSAVICEKMIQANETFLKDKMDERREREDKECIKKLTKLFGQIDVDQSGEIDEEEFSAILIHDDLADELCEAAGCSKYDLIDLFDILAIKSPGEEGVRSIPYRDFICHLRTEAEPPTGRTMLRLQKQIRDLALTQHEMSTSMQWIMERVWDLSKEQGGKAPPSSPSRKELKEFKTVKKPVILGEEYHDKVDKIEMMMPKKGDSNRIEGIY